MLTPRGFFSTKALPKFTVNRGVIEEVEPPCALLVTVTCIYEVIE
jgi:hypothetical protein